MITVDKNTVNKVVLTLTERVKTPSPFCLFVFNTDGDVEDGEIRLLLGNMADDEQRERFDWFELEESSAGIKEGGAINEAICLSEAQYTYKVYETVVESSDLSDSTGRILEVGMMRVKQGEFGVDDSNSVYTGK